jgi:hypothetical protein
VGQISYGKVVVWLIEVMNGPRASIYALVVDENCQVQDKLEVAAQIITSQSHTTIQTTFDEYNEVRPDAETGQIHAETHREQKRYRLDTERRRFVAI